MSVSRASVAGPGAGNCSADDVHTLYHKFLEVTEPPAGLLDSRDWTLYNGFMMRNILIAFFYLLAGVLPLSATVGTPFVPADHPDFYYVPGTIDLPFKCQDETKERVDFINRQWIPGTDHDAWRYLGQDRKGSFKCLAYASAYLADWWRRHLQLTPGEYQSFIHGRLEQGVDPRLLETMYLHRSNRGENHFQLIPRLAYLDPVTRERVPMDPFGYVRILTEKSVVQSLPDPLFGKTFAEYRYQGPMQFGMAENGYLKLFDHQFADPFDKREAILIQGLKAHGPLLVGLNGGIPFGQAVHCVMLIGYGQIQGQTWFCYRENYTMPGQGEASPGRGEPSYRMAQARHFHEAYAFPHTLEVTIKKEGPGWTVMVRVAGVPVNPGSFKLSSGTRDITTSAVIRNSGPGKFRILVPGVHPEPLRFEVRHPFCEPAGVLVDEVGRQ